MFNLNQTVLKVVTRLTNFYTYDVEVKREGTSYVLTGGYAANILQELSQQLNFTYVLIPDPMLTYRFDLATNLSVDLFAASYSLQRASGATVVPTFVTGSSKIQIFLNQRFEASGHDAILLPFQTVVWVFLAFLVGFIAISAGFCAHLVENVDWNETAFQIFCISCQKDAYVVLKSFPLRLIILTTSLTFVMVFTAYSGTIASINAVKKYSINSLDKVIASHFDIGFDYGLDNGSVVQIAADALNNTPIMQNLYRKMRRSKFRFDSFETSIERVSKKPFAYIIDEETGYATIQNTLGFLPCEFASISFARISYPWGMFLPKDSKYRSQINLGIQKLRETGTLRNLMKRNIPGVGNKACSSRSRGEYASASLGQVRSGFSIVAAGAFIGIIISVFERIYFWKRKGKTNVLVVTSISSKNVFK